MPRLEQQLAFIAELHRLKAVLRRNRVPGEGELRRENSAEHSWQLAVMALVLAEHADEPLDPFKLQCMLLLHDLVEIDAGDTFVYDTAGRASQAAREQAAATRIFGLLPADQAELLQGLWEEFEAGETPEARFGRALDRLAPVLANAATAGVAWREHGVTAQQVRQVNAVIGRGSATLWEATQQVIDAAVAAGHLAES